MKKAIITGITGQDGSYLTELLLEKGYMVYGLVRRSSLFNRSRIDHIQDKVGDQLKLVYGDLSDSSSLNGIINNYKPDEIYNLGAQSHVGVSFDIPEYTSDVNGIGTLRLLDGIKNSGMNIKFYQASSSELFGKVKEIPQNENTKFHPRSPYACGKAFSHYLTQNYRESYGLFACNGILFNHESPRRGENFVTRKVTMTMAKIKLGLQSKLYLGNLDSKRDWGYAKEYVRAMWLMLQQKKPDDYIIATGKIYTVRQLVEIAAKYAGFKIIWQGEGLNEKGFDKNTGKEIINIDSKYIRPAEVDILCGDFTKAKDKLKWEPKTKFEEIIKKMVKSDLELFSK